MRKQYNVYLPEQLRQEAQNYVDLEHRSFSNWVETLIRKEICIQNKSNKKEEVGGHAPPTSSF